MLNSALNERKPQSSIFSFDIRSGSLFFLDRKQKQSCFAEKFLIFLINNLLPDIKREATIRSSPENPKRVLVALVLRSRDGEAASRK